MTNVSLSRGVGTQVIAPKPSLVISPNLDALLEHDERIRRLTTPDTLSLTVAPGAELFIGLPPPPRGPRKKSLRRTNRERSKSNSPRSHGSAGASPRTESDPEANTSANLPNPFINPAPSMEIILKADTSIVPPLRSSSMNPTTSMSPRDRADSHGSNPFTTIEGEIQSGVNADTPNGEPKRSVPPSQPADPSHERAHPPLSLPRIQVKAKNLLGIFSDSSVAQEKAGEYHVISTERDLDGHPKSRKRGKLVKLKDLSTETTTWTDTRQKSGAVGSNNRLLLSHAHPARSSASSLSSHSDSMYGPSTVANEALVINISSEVVRSPPSPNMVFGHHTPITVTSGVSDDHHGSRDSHEFYSLSEFSQNPHHPLSYKVSETDPYLTSHTERSPKPPLPTSPKPNFNRPTSGPPTLRKKSPSPGHGAMKAESPTSSTLPPTTNRLNPDERAELIKKNRKLTHMFGQIPEAESLTSRDPRKQSLSSPRPSHQRGALSMDGDPSLIPIWPPAEGTLYLTPNGRRHSSPLSPTDFPFLSEQNRHSSIEVGSTEAEPGSLTRARKRRSLTSLSDLSGDETNINTGKHPAESPLYSTFEDLNGDKGEEDRRRKREKLAKLHRFLGSQVPVNLVLGITEAEPKPSIDASVASRDVRMPWLRRRRSSSALAWPTSWSDDIDRLREDLDDREKAVNVRRALKMEKVFGELPPQTLYHTRNSPSLSIPSAGPSLLRRPSVTSTEHRKSRSERSTSSKRKPARPETYDSETFLLSYGLSDDYDFTSPPPPLPKRHSDVYTHYQHSLNSLHDIIDRDDKESLAELHRYLNSELPDVLDSSYLDMGSSIISPSPSRSERRRSLPTTTSMLSVSSMFSVTSPEHELTDFQLRRRKAAKLTQFFGVDYRDLIKDVLESIEKGVGDDCESGTLHPREAEDLLQKLHSLRQKPSTTI